MPTGREPLTIDSLDDPRVEGYRHVGDPAWLAARGVFVAEGRLVVRRLSASPRWTLESILVTAAAAEGLADAIGAMTSPVYLISQALMNEVAGFNIHRGCLGLAKRPAPRALDDDAISRASRIVVLEGVNNPDNVGGIFRSAAAFGADLVVLGPDCGDPLYRKAVRTSMAAVLEVPFVDAGPWPDALSRLREAGFTVLALTPGPSAVPLSAIGPLSRAALLAGAEGPGLSAAALDAADRRVRIPTSSRVDSLNVTTALSIAMYHAFAVR